MNAMSQPVSSPSVHPVMDVTYREQVSPGGVNFNVLLSAMQKCARRGMRDEMEFAVRELCAFLDVELGLIEGLCRCGGKQVTLSKSSVTNFLHRLAVIYLEDVHPAEPQIWHTVEGILKRMHESRTVAGRTEFLTCGLALCELLTKGGHSRLYCDLDDISPAVVPAHFQPALGRVQNRANWQCDGDLYIPELYQSTWWNGGQVSIFQSIDLKWWLKQMPTSSQRKGDAWDHRWLVGAAAEAHVVLQPGSLPVYPQKPNIPPVNMWGPNLQNPYQVSGQPVPDFFASAAVMDIHTSEAKKVGPVIAGERFIFLGARVIGDPHLLPPDKSILQARLKKIGGDCPNDLDALLNKHPVAKDALKSNLPASMLIWPGESLDGAGLFVWVFDGLPGFLKGPFSPTKDLEVWFNVYQLKKRLNGLSPLRPWGCLMIPDLELDAHVEVPAPFDRTKPHRFLLWRSLLPETLPSRLTPAVVIGTPPMVQVQACMTLDDVDSLSAEMRTALWLALIAKWMMGTPDRGMRDMFVDPAAQSCVYTFYADLLSNTEPGSVHLDKALQLVPLERHAAQAGDAAILPVLRSWLPTLQAEMASGQAPIDLNPVVARLQGLIAGGSKTLVKILAAKR